MRLRDTGRALKHRPKLRKVRVAWVRAFGLIPTGFTVIALDGDCRNTGPENLALVAPQSRLRKLTNSPRRRASQRIQWTREQIKILRRDFATRPTAELAQEFGGSVQAIRIRARRLKLRKSRDFFAEQVRCKRRLPLGSERVDRTCDTVLVKVSLEGGQYQQWRRKHHVVWEEANGRRVPKGFRVLFKDGNKRNFDAANLQIATQQEVAAHAFAQVLSYPASLRAAIRMTRKLQREVQRAPRWNEKEVASLYN